MTTETEHLLGLTAEITAAFVANNPVKPDELGGIVPAIYEALQRCGGAPEPEVAAARQFVPAVSVRASQKHDVLISLIDGKPYKSLKRHLTGHGLTPDEYRKRYGLKDDYPMVAPGYAEVRRALAKKIGLGRHPQAGRGRSPGRKATSSAARH